MSGYACYTIEKFRIPVAIEVISSPVITEKSASNIGYFYYSLGSAGDKMMSAQ